MPRGWRIVKASRAAAAFDGEGARLYGGRWNSPGTALVYLAESEALAALELLVHLRAPELLASYVSIPADFDDALVRVLGLARLPRGWRRSPAPSALRRIGDRFAAEGRAPVLRVPSAVVPRESNYLVNPAHPDFARVAIGRPRSFDFDPRLR